MVRVPLKAGVHEIRATFPVKTGAMAEGFRRPYLKPYIGTGTSDQRETREGAALRELEIMGPLNPGSAESSPSHRRVFVCHPASATCRGGRALRENHPLDAGAPGLSPAGQREDIDGAARRLQRGPRQQRLRGRHRHGGAAHPREPVVPVPHRVRAGDGGELRPLSHQRPRAGLAAVVLPLEQHPRRRAARIWRPRASCTSRPSSSARPGGCSPIRARRRSPPTSPASGWRCAG